jgi:hypothetical protein
VRPARVVRGRDARRVGRRDGAGQELCGSVDLRETEWATGSYSGPARVIGRTASGVRVAFVMPDGKEKFLTVGEGDIQQAGA